VARLRDTHVARFGASKVSIIQDAALPAPLETLKASGTAHIQVISVEPHYAKYKAMGRVGSFELNHLVDEFLLETPFTKSGKARGDVKAQCMRHLIMKVETGTSFPYVKKRLRIVQQETHEMEPIDVALDAMTKKCDSLERVVSAKSKEGDKEGAHPDMKGLQLQLQGIVSIQVNSGPMEYASVFLSTQTRDQFAAKKVKELQEQFARMLSLVDMGLKRNNLTIQADQREYQRDLQDKYVAMTRDLEPLLGKAVKSKSRGGVDGYGSILKRISYSSASSQAKMLGGGAPVMFLGGSARVEARGSTA